MIPNHTREKVMEENRPDSNPPHEQGGAESLPSKDLDDLLAETSSLTETLSEQVGSSTKVPSDAPELPSNDPTVALEAQLAELEQLAGQTSREIGATEPTPQPVPAVAPEPYIPAFMQEFSEPAPPPESPPAVQHPVSADQSTQPGLSAPPEATSTLSESDPQAASDHVRVASLKPAKMAVAVESLDETTSENASFEDSDGKAASRKPSRLWTALSPAALSLGHGAASALEIVNRPFSFVGWRLRMLIGWLAIATAATSVIVFVVSLF